MDRLTRLHLQFHLRRSNCCLAQIEFVKQVVNVFRARDVVNLARILCVLFTSVCNLWMMVGVDGRGSMEVIRIVHDNVRICDGTHQSFEGSLCDPGRTFQALRGWHVLFTALIARLLHNVGSFQLHSVNKWIEEGFSFG